MDFAIRDKRADDTTSWVMGTFVYDASQAEGRHQVWDKIVPVGLQWDNDPNITPQMVKAGAKLKETVITHPIPQYAENSIGFGGRLNGPADFKRPFLFRVSQHGAMASSAQQPPKGQTDLEKMHYFRNLKPDEPFEKGKISFRLPTSFRKQF